MSGSASTTLQYTGIGAFVAIVLLGLVYFGRSIATGRRDVDTGQHGTATASPGQQLGLAPDDVAVLPTFMYLAASPGRWGKAKAVAADGCAVCLEELREGALVRMLPSCKHYFHASCVDVWLLSHATCPVCRASPAPEKVRLGAVSMSPPLPQLQPCGASPKGGETSQLNNVSRLSSRVITSPAHSVLILQVRIWRRLCKSYLSFTLLPFLGNIFDQLFKCTSNFVYMQELKAKVERSPISVVVAGDFNLIWRHADNSSGSVNHLCMRFFNDCIP